MATGAASLPLVGGQDASTLINLTANQTSNAGANSTLIFSEAQAGEGDVPVYTQSGLLAIEPSTELYLPLILK